MALDRDPDALASLQSLTQGPSARVTTLLADVETRKTFGSTQSAAAKAKNDTLDDGESTDDDTTGDDGSDD